MSCETHGQCVAFVTTFLYTHSFLADLVLHPEALKAANGPPEPVQESRARKSHMLSFSSSGKVKEWGLWFETRAFWGGKEERKGKASCYRKDGKEDKAEVC